MTKQTSKINSMGLNLLLANIVGLGFGGLAYLAITGNHPLVCLAFLCLAVFCIVVPKA